jgi:hypothetical protein
MRLLYPLTTLLAVLAAATTVVSAEGTEGDIVVDNNENYHYETAAEAEGRAFDGFAHAIDWVGYDGAQENPEDRTGDVEGGVEGGVIFGGVPVVDNPPVSIFNNFVIPKRKKPGPGCARGSMAGGRGGSGGVGGGGGRRCNRLRGRRQEEAAAAN